MTNYRDHSQDEYFEKLIIESGQSSPATWRRTGLLVLGLMIAGVFISAAMGLRERAIEDAWPHYEARIDGKRIISTSVQIRFRKRQYKDYQITVDYDTGRFEELQRFYVSPSRYNELREGQIIQIKVRPEKHPPEIYEAGDYTSSVGVYDIATVVFLVLAAGQGAVLLFLKPKT